MTKFSVQFWRSEQELLANRQIWDEIFLSSRASAFLSFEWISTRWKYFNEGQKPLIGLVRDGENPVAIVPLEIVSRKIGPVPFRMVRYLLGNHGMQEGAIAREGYSELHMIDTVMLALRSERDTWDFAQLEGFPVHKLSEDLSEDGARTLLHRAARKTETTVIINTPASWEEYKKTLSYSHRQTISRRVRGMERAGRVRHERLGLSPLNGTPELTALLNDAVSVSQRSWQHKSPSGWAISKTSNPEYFHEVSKKLASRGMLDLSVLYLDDLPVSYIWGAARWPRLTIYKPGFDESLSELAPGVVHLAKYIEDSIHRGSVEIDYGTEFFDYKSSWGKKYMDLCALYYYQNGLKPTLLRMFRRKRHAHEIVEPPPVSANIAGDKDPAP